MRTILGTLVLASLSLAGTAFAQSIDPDAVLPPATQVAKVAPAPTDPDAVFPPATVRIRLTIATRTPSMEDAVLEPALMLPKAKKAVASSDPDAVLAPRPTTPAHKGDITLIDY